MSMSKKSNSDNVPSVKIVGVGSAGSNVVNSLVTSGLGGAEFIAIDTDEDTLSVSRADVKIQIDAKPVKGQNAVSNPDTRTIISEESRNIIAKTLDNTDVVLLIAGLERNNNLGGN